MLTKTPQEIVIPAGDPAAGDPVTLKIHKDAGSPAGMTASKLKRCGALIHTNKNKLAR